jgi:ATPase subunit of ABC transporter with duplicated ATPase domains
VLTYASVHKSFDGQVALSDVTFSVERGERVAVVGANGSGKSTLLRLAAGELTPDAGKVTLAAGASVAYVPQDYALVAEELAVDYLKQRAGLLGLERRLRRLERAMAEGDQAAADDYADAVDRYAALGGWAFEARAARALDDLRLPEALLQRPIGELSGGQQVRIGLAGVLAASHDLFLLDEPTNNLDLPALDLLENFVATDGATFVLVSHDRAFLRATATSVVAMDEHAHTAELYGVPYVDYLAARERSLAARNQRYRDHLDEVGRLRRAIAKQRTAAGKDKDTRRRRDGDKFAPHFFAQRSHRQAGKSLRNLEQRLARLPEVEKPWVGWELRLRLDSAERSGDLVVAADQVTKTYGTFTLGPVSTEVRWRDRIAIAGHNGAGKSVLLGLLTGTTEPEAGQVRRGSGVRFGVLRQGGQLTSWSPDGRHRHDGRPGGQADAADGGRAEARPGSGGATAPGNGDAATGDAATGLEIFQREVGAAEAEARTLLAKFDLGAGHVHRPVSTWSPGERCRPGLAILMAQGVNCLVLDEPTNHLDLEALEELEQALTGFGGTLLVVSHDREFLDRIGITRTWALEDGTLVADEPL